MSTLPTFIKKGKLILIIFLFLLFNIICISEEEMHQDTFFRSYSVEKRHNPKKVIITSTNDYIILSTVRDGNNLDIHLLKIDKYCNQIWEKRYNKDQDDWAQDIIELNSGNLLITVSSYHAYFRIFLLEVDKDGNQIYYKFLANDYQSSSIVEDKNSNYFLCSRNRDRITRKTSILLYKINQKGKVLWSKKIGGHLTNECCEKLLISNNNLYLLGYEEKNHKRNAKVYSVNTNGDIKWEKILSKKDESFFPSNILSDANGNIVISINSDKSNSYLYLLNSNGELLSKKDFNNLHIYKMLKDPKGDDIILLGSQEDNLNILKVNIMNEPRIEFQKTFSNINAPLISASLTDDGGLIFLFDTNKISIIKTNKQLEISNLKDKNLTKLKNSTKAELLYKEIPQYPEYLRKKKVQGTVCLNISLDEFGEIENVAIFQSSGNEELDNISIKAAKKCKFKPAVQNGTPVKCEVLLYYKFSPKE